MAVYQTQERWRRYSTLFYRRQSERASKNREGATSESATYMIGVLGTLEMTLSEFEKGMIAGGLLIALLNFIADIFIKPFFLRWLARNDRKE